MKRLSIMLLSLAAIAAGQTLQHSASLTWQDTVNPPSTAYNAYRLTAACPATVDITKFTKVNTAPITVKTFVDNTVTVGNTYCYVITATQPNSESFPSNTVSGIVLDKPSNVTISIQVTVTVTAP